MWNPFKRAATNVSAMTVEVPNPILRHMDFSTVLLPICVKTCKVDGPWMRLDAREMLYIVQALRLAPHNSERLDDFCDWLMAAATWQDKHS